MNEAIVGADEAATGPATLDDHQVKHLVLKEDAAPGAGSHWSDHLAHRLRLDVLRLAVDAAPAFPSGKDPNVILDLAARFHLFVTGHSSAPGSVGGA